MTFLRYLCLWWNFFTYPRTKLTNTHAYAARRGTRRDVLLSSCSGDLPARWVGATDSFRRLLLTFEAVSDLGREMTADRDFPETARVLLSSLCDTVNAREGALFLYSDRPSMLASVAAQGFANFPPVAVIPLLPKHVHALTQMRLPQVLSAGNHELYLSSNGNVAPDLFKFVAPLRVRGKLVGLVALGRRQQQALYGNDEVEAMALLCDYVALAVHNHSLGESLEQRISENLRLLASLHKFYDNALEAFANAIDIKEYVHGHSLRVGHYAACIGEAVGLGAMDVSGLRAAGYLHDIGNVAVDKRIFVKPAALDADEFREMADHTIVGHRIVSGIEFPWPIIPQVVRNHHERADGSGYPDRLRLDEVPQAVRIVSVAEAFDAMVSDRPYRSNMSVGQALSEFVRLTPDKFDPLPVQGLLIQVRRDAVGSNKTPFLDKQIYCNIAPNDVDQIAALLHHKLSNGRVYNC
ncbi:MAG: HD-GYP domain-containing protein [Terriglobales bacterium]